MHLLFALYITVNYYYKFQALIIIRILPTQLQILSTKVVKLFKAIALLISLFKQIKIKKKIQIYEMENYISELLYVT